MHIHWFRRDLRLSDNTALHAAAAGEGPVVPVYVVSDWKKIHPWTGPGRQEFLCGCLASLAKNLDTIGGRLIIRQGGAVEELRKLVRETKATAIFANRDPDPHGREVETALAAMAREEGSELHLLQDVAIHERDEVRTATGTIFRVFSPYARAWRTLAKPEMVKKPVKLHTPPGIKSLDLPTLVTWGWQGAAGKVAMLEPGERAARERLRHFMAGPVLRYGAKRNFPGEEGVSRLSQDLRWGLLSAREVYFQAMAAAEKADATGRRSAETYVSELIWREFNLQILWHNPEVLERSFNPKYDAVAWREDQAAEEHFQRWCAGQTGFPIVDAAMRQLVATGFMHNRLRMVAAMFLTKDLHIHWKRGEQFFMHHLIDGEIASNNGGWQWSAGTGADAAPYFRIQNPWLQAAKFDPTGEFTKKWVPELAGVDVKKLAEPPAGIPLAKGYPLPMVDHKTERDVTLELFKKALNETSKA